MKTGWREMLAGAEFIWRKKVILGASSLDLFAVLLGGATALLPVYADQILHVGPIGLGWLRAAPSLGAFAMAMWLAHRRPLARQLGGLEQMAILEKRGHVPSAPASTPIRSGSDRSRRRPSAPRRTARRAVAPADP